MMSTPDDAPPVENSSSVAEETPAVAEETPAVAEESSSVTEESSSVTEESSSVTEESSSVTEETTSSSPPQQESPQVSPDGQVNLLSVPINNENDALNVLIGFLSVAQRRGVFAINESAKIFECVKKFHR